MVILNRRASRRPGPTASTQATVQPGPATPERSLATDTVPQEPPRSAWVALAPRTVPKGYLTTAAITTPINTIPAVKPRRTPVGIRTLSLRLRPPEELTQSDYCQRCLLIDTVS